MECKNPLCKLKGKKIYGFYCYKHRREYLVDNNIIIKTKFTGKLKDYLKKDILNTLLKENCSPNLLTSNKDILFDLLSEKIKYQNIIKIQRFFRRYLYFIKGPGYKDKSLSKNLEDFYTLENIKDIDNKYFVSYKDKNDNIWCFDIRSIKQLIDEAIKDKKEVLNPYNREVIDERIINKIKNIIKKYKKKKISLTYEDEGIIYSREETLKRNTVDIFSEITRLGYFMDVRWFDSRNLIGLKALYKYLEDLWNYRAQLDFEVKKKIAPPNGILYSTRVRDVYNMNNILEVKEIIINELKKIYDNCDNNNDKRLGYMYFIIGLSQVSINCYNSHSDWISFIY